MKVLKHTEYDGAPVTIYEDGSVVVLGKKGRPLKQKTTVHGYLSVQINRVDTLVHRIVALELVPSDPNSPIVNHKDGDKLNNRPSNLEWTTIAGNTRHALDNGLHHNPEQAVVAYRKDHTGLWFRSQNEAQRHGFFQTAISACLRGRRKTHKTFHWTHA